MACHLTYLFLIIMLIFEDCFSKTEKSMNEKDMADHKKILVISLDGFAHSYLSKYNLVHLSALFSSGSTSQKFGNQFPTKTFPNHFTVGTGVYEDVHGVVSNYIYDPVLEKNLKIDDEGFFTDNPDIYPIWTLNEANGGHSGCIMWPGCGVEFHERNVTYWFPYEHQVALKDSIQLALQWFTNNSTPANLIFLYHEQPDGNGHAYGPDSPFIKEELMKIDDALGYLFHMITLHNLQDHLDIIILSDHGMSAVPESNIIDLDKIIDPNEYHYSGGSPVLNIWTTMDHQINVYNTLVEASHTHNFTVYEKGTWPDNWHYRNNHRISPLLLVADEGFVFQDFLNVINSYKRQNLPDLTDVHGDHGYPVDIESMEPIFLAVGPSFKRRFKASPFSNVDVYLLLCHLLSLSPGPTNGTLTNISTILSQPIISALVEPLLIALGCLVGLMGVVGIIACAFAKRDSRRPVSADSLINGYVHRKTMRGGHSVKTEDDASEEESLLEREVVTVNL